MQTTLQDLIATHRDDYAQYRRCMGTMFNVLGERRLSDIGEDLHAMQQVVSNGQYNYWAPRTKEGHSDRCTAAALGVRAAGDLRADFKMYLIGAGAWN